MMRVSDKQYKQLLDIQKALEWESVKLDSLLKEMKEQEDEQPTEPIEVPVEFTGKKVAICVGHSRSGDNGAINTDGVSEHTYNGQIAHNLSQKLSFHGIKSKVFDYYEGSGYGSAMSWIGDQVKKYDADIAIELHFNSATPSAAGYEYLYWHSSSSSKALADSLLKAQEEKTPQMKNRGIKPKTSSDRGSGFLSKTHCPSVITEPYFGSNNKETIYYRDKSILEDIYTKGIVNYFAK
tara:strand:+ start:5352 stop:6062 length:711 start_codon:yes stop_codon:yes gene_type:complete